MAKDWKITQYATIAGDKVSASFLLPHMESADVTAFCQNLEGGYQVTEINETMSDMTNADINVATSNPISYINCRGEAKQTEFISGFGGKPIYFKNTVTPDEIRATLANKTIFAAVPTEKVAYVGMKSSERIL